MGSRSWSPLRKKCRRGRGLNSLSGAGPKWRATRPPAARPVPRQRQPAGHSVQNLLLDYHYDHSPRDVQKRVLIRQLELAREVKLPIVIHCREAWSDLRQIIGDHWARAGIGGFLHCFSGSREDAVAFLDWGFLLSFAGNLTFKKAEPLRALAREVPVDRLLSETDSPYLAPAPYRGKRNEPAYVLEVTRELASLHNLSEEDMGRQAVANFARLFRLE